MTETLAWRTIDDGAGFARALELLRQQRTVMETCQAVGFRHISHFSREFKALFDMTPSAFQRQSRDQR